MDARDRGWGPYLPGALSGVVIVLSVLVADTYFGASSSFVRTAGLLEKVFAPERMERMDYFSQMAPVIDWQWMFVLGILLGAFVSAITSGNFRAKALPDMWQGRFGAGRARRFAVAFLGGLIIMFGARMAGG